MDLSKIFRPSGKTVIVAMEHGLVYNVQPELLYMEKVIKQVIAGGADGIIVSYGIARKYRNLLKDTSPIIRLDAGFSELSTEHRFDLLYSVEDAIGMGAVGVVCMGFTGGSQATETLPGVSAAAVQCDKAGIPLMAEMLPGGFTNEPPNTPENIRLVSRMGTELGAHIIKTAFTGTKDEFKAIIDGCLSPVVVLGGQQTKDVAVFLNDIETAMAAGASGVAIGRNVWQHKDAADFTAALVQIVHEGKSSGDALKLIT